MEREIEFKAIYSYDNPPIIFEQVEIDGELFFYNKIHDLTHPFTVPFLDDDWTLLQYIGHNDKYGVKIFRGDIYTQGCSNIKYEVIFRGCGFVGRQVNNNSLVGISHFIKSIVICGNIHEQASK